MTKVFEPHEIHKKFSLEDMPGEIWKDVIGWEGAYQVSNLGRIKSITRTLIRSNNTKLYIRGGILKQSNHFGYLKVAFTSQGHRTIYMSHVLVAIHFIPNTENKRVVNHKDGNKANNCVDNLEWNTDRENLMHAISTGLWVAAKGEETFFSKLTNIDIVKIKRMFIDGMSHIAISKHFNVTRSTITRVLNGTAWKHVIDENWTEKDEKALLEKCLGNRKGERHHGSKLTESDVKRIREMRKSGIKIKEIAEHFPVSSCTISEIVKGSKWPHVV